MVLSSFWAGRLAGLCLLLAAVLPAQDWKTANTLPGVDMSSLSAKQKSVVLKVLREHGCSCGCNMKLAECRIVDPGCAYSTNLAATAITASKGGKSESEIVAALESSQWAHLQEPPLLSAPVNISTSGAPVTGPSIAAVTLVEFSDFQCPYCATAVGQLKEVLKMYPTQVKLFFKQFPLEIHPQADLAAAAAVAAQKQGKFWQMHDAMFSHANNLSRHSILEMAQQTGLDLKRFEEDMDSTVVRETVARDVQDGDRAGVQGTPTLFINGQHYNGAISMDALKQVIDNELKSKVAKNER